MTFTDYQEQIKRTNKDAGSILMNSIHMTTGMVTELGEIMECIYFKLPHQTVDEINLKEEAGDLFWYCGNFANFWGYRLTEVSFRHKAYYFTSGVDPLIQLTIRIAILQDFDKKELAYSKAKNQDKVKEAFFDILKAVSDFCLFYGIIPEQAMQLNIDKLRVRYPEKFSEESAIDRDLVKERKVLES